MVMMFSKPDSLVDCRLGTRPLNPVTSVTNDLSRVTAGRAVIALGVFWMSVARRSAVTTISLSSVRDAVLAAGVLCACEASGAIMAAPRAVSETMARSRGRRRILIMDKPRLD